MNAAINDPLPAGWHPRGRKAYLWATVTNVSSQEVGFSKMENHLPILRNLITTLAMNSWLVKNLIGKFKEN